MKVSASHFCLKWGHVVRIYIRLQSKVQFKLSNDYVRVSLKGMNGSQYNVP